MGPSQQMDPAGNRIWFLTSSTTCLNVIQGHKLGADGSSTAVFPRPKPQNLGGLVGGEAEFDPLGFSDTFDAPGTLTEPTPVGGGTWRSHVGRALLIIDDALRHR